MSQVNLLPPELRERQRVRRFTSLVILSGFGLLALVGLLYLLQVMNLGRVEDELRAQRSTNANLSADISELQPFAQLQSLLQRKQELVATVFQNEISWSSVLQDVSRMIPSDAYLTDLNGAVSRTTTTEPQTDEDAPPLVGNVSFTGISQDLDSLTMWLTNLERVKGWVNPWVASAQSGQSEGGVPAYQFNGSVDLSTQAVTRRGSRGAER